MFRAGLEKTVNLEKNNSLRWPIFAESCWGCGKYEVKKNPRWAGFVNFLIGFRELFLRTRPNVMEIDFSDTT